MKYTLIAILLCLSWGAEAHDQWADGSAVPGWIKSACCGPMDAHVIDSSDVSGPDKAGNYRVKDIEHIVPGEHVYDSLDGETWVFYDPRLPPQTRAVYCLFLARGF